MSGTRAVASRTLRPFRPSRSEPAPASPSDRSGGRNRPVLQLLAAGLVCVVVLVCVLLRFLAHRDLWLDEALSVNIARPSIFHGVGGLLEALRHDGSPPLYYLLLHAWMRLLGTGDFAVRSLSAGISALTLPLAWVVGRRVGGKVAAWGLVLLLASSPFAIRYASETRMYSMLVLLSLVLYLAWAEAVRRPAAGRLLALAGATALLLLTHYWGFYLLGALFGVTVLRGVGGRDRRRAAMLAMAAMGAGLIPFLPWVPSFLFQLRHTGTPWGQPPTLRSLRSTIQIWTDSGMLPGIFLGWVLVALGIAAVLDRRSSGASHAGPAGGGRELGGGQVAAGAERPSWHALNLCLLVLGTFALAIAAGALFHVSFAARYTSVILPLFLLLAALGLRFLPGVSKWALLGFCVACGLFVAVTNVDLKRTQTGDVARVLRSRAVAGDVIVYCPDQLGPGTSRLAPSGIPQMTFPSFGAPQLVDWVDYRQRYAAADPAAFAREVDQRAGAGRVWLVFNSRYHVAGPACADLTTQLAALRPPQISVVRLNDRVFENAWLLLYEPAAR